MQLFGHRGGSDACPENTRAAFVWALQRGVAGVECDLQLLKCGTVIVLHDDTLERTGTATVSAHTSALLSTPVSELSWEEVAGVDIGSRIGGSSFSGERLLRFEDFLQLVGSFGQQCSALVEVKGGEHAIVAPAAAIARQSLSAGVVTPRQLRWIGFDLSVICALKARSPGSQCIHVVELTPAAKLPALVDATGARAVAYTPPIISLP